ncbi:Uncharacterized protein PCOAH_00034330 [Plasmodium coatneyi]|uniref:Uncharacterized protein n=1 Tax=Plasmodium coatneyi TaxID=208452 RepID=A0A1B1E1F0_9APIC|nr:Uncharacterized protein PCOAH_00034330 [Plasmodium coatneyi]ANQ08872.1 Uncharacterized protein PCOAH_00034330 [Plasmodium coatneyi]
MERPDGSAENSENGPNCEESSNTTFSFDMLDIIITGGNTGRLKSQEKGKKHMTENTTEKWSFYPSGERVENSGRTERTEPGSSRRKKCTKSDEDAVKFTEGLHNLGKKEKKRKTVYRVNSEEDIKDGSEFSLLDKLLPVGGTPGLASSKEEMPILDDQVSCLSSDNSSREEHYHMDGKGDKHSDTSDRHGKYMNEQDVDAQLARIEWADEEVILAGSIHCTNCKYYLKELTSRNYMDFSYMDQYISEGERNLLLLKNKKIEELENRNRSMKHKIGKLEEVNNFLNSKLDTLASSIGDLRDHIDKLMEENKLLKEVNKRLRVDLQKGQSYKEEVERANKKDTNRKNPSSSSHGRREPLEENFENSIDNELFKELC